MATTKDVAALAGVSFTTVSHVINNTRPVSPETRERVEAAIKELGYSPNILARALRKGETKTVGVISISNADPYFAGVLHAIQQVAWGNGYGVYTSCTDPCTACLSDGDVFDYDDGALGTRERKAIASMVGRDIQGLVLNSLQSDKALKATIEGLRTPCILFQRLVRGSRWDNYISDDRQGTQDAMRHLIGLGHRRIALVKGFSYESNSAHQREKAWRDSLVEAGIAVDPSLIRDGRFDQCISYEQTKELLTSASRPSAILYYSDLMALAGIRAASDLGLSIPRDLSIVGYDNIDLDNWSVPRLTSVNQVSGDMGRDMTERLLDRIKNPELPGQVFKYPQQLVERESTGPVSKG